MSDSAAPWTVTCQAPLSLEFLRILEWGDMLSSRGSSPPTDKIDFFYISCIGRQVLYHWHRLATRETRVIKRAQSYSMEFIILEEGAVSLK